MARVFTRSGTEGPRHDPYHYTEVSFVKTNGDVVECKVSGLGYGLLSVNDAQLFKGDDLETEKEFERITGISYDKALEIPEILQYRAMRRMTPQERNECYSFMEADRRMLENAL